MYWSNLTRLELSKFDKKTPVLLLIAAIEQHGEHLPLNTDLLIGEYFCKNLSAILKDRVLIAPSVAVACSGHHMDFTGTLSVTHSVFFNYLQDLLKSILSQGFTKIIIFNSHGGNQAIGQTLVESTGLLYPQSHLLMVSWWKLASEKLRLLNQSGFGGVGHACEFETSIVAAIDEKLVRAHKIKNTGLQPMPDWARGDLLKAPAVAYHRSMRELTGDGVFGNPECFSIKKGQQITKIVVAELQRIVLDITNW